MMFIFMLPLLWVGFFVVWWCLFLGSFGPFFCPAMVPGSLVNMWRVTLPMWLCCITVFPFNRIWYHKKDDCNVTCCCSDTNVIIIYVDFFFCIFDFWLLSRALFGCWESCNKIHGSEGSIVILCLVNRLIQAWPFKSSRWAFYTWDRGLGVFA